MNSNGAGDDEVLQTLIVQIADDFADRLRRGESPDIDAYLELSPDHASVIRQVLQSLKLVRDLSAVSHEDRSSSSGKGESFPDTIGDFQLIREIGRGGMGVVYEARQMSLHRRVALKVLPLGVAMDERQRKRFEIEAQAVARLQHPHITPVHEVGCDQGIHFYAMALVEGHSLAQVIGKLIVNPDRLNESNEKRSRLRWGTDLGTKLTADNGASSAAYSLSNRQEEVDREIPELAGIQVRERTTPREYFRRIAQIGAQIAEALEHAHQLGVVHRDIKPSNLMLDGAGHPWVMDFGLASIDLSLKLTMTGELVGTLRYMSPEQADVGQHTIDHRTDIYSLGATLYELLTLRAPFDATNRSALMHQVLEVEPQPLRQLNPAIPSDLSVIVLKAMSKDRADRYATSQAFADDLRRFLQDVPILGRPPTFTQRLNRWRRRNRALVRSAIVLLVLASCGLAINNVAIYQREAQTERERQRAERNLELARGVVDRMFTHLANDLREIPHAEHIRSGLLEEALAFYQDFLADSESNHRVRRDAGLAHLRLGKIHELLGRSDRAEVSFRAAIPFLEELREESPSDPSILHDLADAHGALGLRLMWANHHEEMLLHRRRELAIREQLYLIDSADLSHRMRLAVTLTEFGNSLKLTSLEEAEQHLRRAVTVLRDAPADASGDADFVGTQAHCHQWLGVFLLQTGSHFAHAEHHLRHAEAIRKGFADERPMDPDLQGSLAQAQGYLAETLMRLGRVVEAETYCRSAISIRQSLAEQYADVADHRRQLAWLLEVLSDLAWSRGMPEDSMDDLKQAVAIRKDLSITRPGLQPYADELAWAHYRLGLVSSAMTQPDEAKSEFSQARQLAESSVAPGAGNASAGHVLVWQLADCPVTEFRDAERAVGLAEAAIKISPDAGGFWRQSPLIGGNQFVLGVALCRAGRWHEAATALRDSIRRAHGGDCRRWLYLSLAEYQLGNRDEAEIWRNKANDALRQDYFTDPELWLLCREVDSQQVPGGQTRLPSGHTWPTPF